MGNKNQKLLEAAGEGRLDDVKRLVTAGADKNTKNDVSEFHSSFTLNNIALVYSLRYMLPPL